VTERLVDVPGYVAPLHRALTDPILLGGAPRSYAIVNGTLAAALGLGLQEWLPGLAVWIVGHAVGVLLAKRDPQFLEVLIRHVRHKGWLAC
jgi:type IV secretion system protein VirB3